MTHPAGGERLSTVAFRVSCRVTPRPVSLRIDAWTLWADMPTPPPGMESRFVDPESPWMVWPPSPGEGPTPQQRRVDLARSVTGAGLDVERCRFGYRSVALAGEVVVASRWPHAESPAVVAAEVVMATLHWTLRSVYGYRPSAPTRAVPLTPGLRLSMRDVTPRGT